MIFRSFTGPGELSLPGPAGGGVGQFLQHQLVKAHLGALHGQTDDIAPGQGLLRALRKAVVQDGPGMDLVKALCAGEGLAVARFNCLHDSFFAWENMKEAAVCQRNGFG